MPDKTAILENIEMYSVDEIVDLIRQGIVTFDELCNDTDGNFRADIRKEVKKKLEGSEEEHWQKVQNAHSINELEGFITTYPQSQHCAEAKKLIELYKKEDLQIAGNDAWVTLDKDSISELTTFCQNFPENPHCQEATKKINQLQREEILGFDIKSLEASIHRISTDNLITDPNSAIYDTIVDCLTRKKISHSDLLEMIKSDNNILNAHVITLLLDNGYLAYKDFDTIKINKEFQRHLAKGTRQQSFPMPDKLDKINKLSTEVYFWGIPSSGKSCALGAILNVAGNGTVATSMKKDNDCQGYGYMTRLAALFKVNPEDSVCTLPEGTSIYSTYEMGFDLEDANEASHPITCIDLAGELVRCMYKSDAKEYMSDDEIEALDTLTRVLIDNRTKNRKIHFFVLEYGAEERIYEGLAQKEYLDGALRYIQRTGIFKNDTDAIYLMITKVDKAKASTSQELKDILRDYVSQAYRGFYNGIKKICKECEINNGEVEVIPFSLGTVCFQDYCLFNEKYANQVVRRLLTRTKGFKHGKFQRVMNKFKN